MSDEVEIAEVPAPELEVTATPEPEEVAPEETEVKQSKTFSQEELDAAIGKRLAREQRKWEREQSQRPVAKAAEVPPALDQFDNVDDYAEALAISKAEQLLADREAKRQQSELLESYHDREEEARGKYDDFEQVAYNPNLPITTVMAQTIQSSEVGPDLAYYLGTNPKEADRISRLQPFMQAKEIGRIEAKLISSPPVKKTSTAPSPISPVTAKSNGNSAYDTTDPRSVKTMTTSQWIEADRQRQAKKFELSKLR
jgi:hypothetical protein